MLYRTASPDGRTAPSPLDGLSAVAANASPWESTQLGLLSAVLPGSLGTLQRHLEHVEETLRNWVENSAHPRSAPPPPS